MALAPEQVASLKAAGYTDAQIADVEAAGRNLVASGVPSASEQAAIQAYTTAPPPHAGSTYVGGRTSMATRDERDFMYGRDPYAAQEANARSQWIADNAGAAAGTYAQGAASSGVQGEGYLYQRAGETLGQTQSDANALRWLADNVATTGRERSEDLTATGARVAALGEGYASGLQNTGAGAALLGTNLGAQATQAGQQYASGLAESGGRAAATGAALGQGLGQAGTQAAQTATSLSQGITQAGQGAAATGARASSALSGAAEGGRIAGQQALGGLGAAGAGALMTGRTEGERLQTQAGIAANRGNVETNFDQANATLGGATRTAGVAATDAERAGQSTAEYARNAASNTANKLEALDATEGPSAAQAQLQLGSNRALNQQLAMAKSGRGLSGNASAMDNAGRNMATIQSDLSNQSAVLRANEESARRQRQIQALSAGGGMQLDAANVGLGAGQLGLAGDQLSTQSQLAAAGQQSGQEQFRTTSAVQQQALRDQTSTAYNLAATQAAQTGQAQSLGALTSGYQANLAGQGINTQALTAGGNQALQGQAINTQAATSAAGLGFEGQQARLAALQAGAGVNMQGQGLGIQAQTAGAGIGMQGLQTGIQAAQTGQAQNLAAQQAAAGYGLQGAQAGAGIQQGAAQLGLDAGTVGSNIYGQGANLALSGQQTAGNMQQQAAALGMGGYQAGAGIYAQGIDQRLAAQGVQNQTNQIQQTGNLAFEDAVTREYAIRQGALEADNAAKMGMIGMGIQAGAAVLGAVT